MNNREPEQFTLDRTDKLRTEIDNKLDTMSARIDHRVTYTNFHWTLTALIGLTTTAFIGCYVLLNNSNRNYETIKDRVLALEIKQDSLQKH